jgi:pimeloyl-ACP methyl ester carboxylesterase
MGGAVAIHTASLDARIDGVVTDGAFSRLQRIVETSISRFTGLPRWPFGPLAVLFAGWSVGADLTAQAPVDWLAGYRGPLLLVQGATDETVTPDQVDELSRSATRADVWKVDGAGHVEAHGHAPQEYDARVAAFLKSVWGTGSSPSA